MTQAPMQDQNNAQNNGQKQTPNQNHLKAAEHFDEASKNHKEAAKLSELGDNKTAGLHSTIAQGHTAHAVASTKK